MAGNFSGGRHKDEDLARRLFVSIRMTPRRSIVVLRKGDGYAGHESGRQEAFSTLYPLRGMSGIA